MRCEEHERLELQYLDAWIRRDNNAVIEYQRRIREHKENCTICSGLELASQLWPDVKVGVDVG